MAGIFDWFRSRKGPERVSAPPPVRDYYIDLGIGPEASPEEIRAAFREISKKYHPDRNPDPAAREIFESASEAYRILSDTDLRQAYDVARRAAEPEAAPKGMIPKPPPEEEEKRPRQLRRPEPPPERKLSWWEKAIPKSEEKELPIEGFFAPSQRREEREAHHSPWGRRQKPEPVRVSLTTPEEMFQFIHAYWPLDPVWDIIRQLRQDPEFQRTGTLLVSRVAGKTSGSSLEYEIAEMLGVPIETVSAYDRAGQLTSAFWTEAVIPLLKSFPEVMGSLKPQDLPGVFYLDYSPDGTGIDLLYHEALA